MGRGENANDDEKDRESPSEQQLQAFELSRRVFLVVLGSWSMWISAKLFYQRQLDLIFDQIAARLHPQRSKAPISLNTAFANQLLDAPLAVAEKQLGHAQVLLIVQDEIELRRRTEQFFRPASAAAGTDADPSDPKALNWLLYCRMHTICSVLPARSARRLFMESLGNALLESAVDSRGAIPREPTPDGIVSAVGRVLQNLEEVGFISGFKVEMSSLAEELLADGERAQMTVFADDVATMPAAQTMAGESYNDLAPVFIGPMLASLIEASGASCDFEEFYIDNTFQRNPYAYDPTGVVVQFNLQLMT